MPPDSACSGRRGQPGCYANASWVGQAARSRGGRTARPSVTRVAATRSARAGSSGQPMTAASRSAGTGAARSASTRAPRPWRSDPAKRDCGRPRTHGSGSGRPAAAQRHADGHRARVAVRHAGADRGAEVEHAPGSTPSPDPAGTSASAVAWSTGAPGHPAQHPHRVHVEHAHVGLERERQHRPGRVRPDPRQREQLGQRRRHPASVPGHHQGGGAVEVDGPAVVAEPRPRPHHLGHRMRPRRRPGRGSAPAAPASGPTTRATWVCCSASSATRTAHGSRVRRQGRSRPWSRTTSSSGRCGQSDPSGQMSSSV